MDHDLRAQIRRATEASDIHKSDFIELLRLIDAHYDKMEATITQSLTTTTPIEAIFDSVTEGLMSVSESGEIRICNKVCERYFGLTKDQLIGSRIEHLLPEAKGKPVAKFLEPFMSSLDDTHVDYEGGEPREWRLLRRRDQRQRTQDRRRSRLCHQPARHHGPTRSGTGAQGQ